MAQAYTITRVMPNGTETTVRVVSTVDADDAAIRANIFAEARTLKSQQAGRRYVVYGPTDDDTPPVPDDRVWDSSVDL